MSPGYTTIQCPKCQRSLPPKMTVCQFCGASLDGVARPVPVAKKVKQTEPWIMTLYYVLAGYWIFGGVMLLVTAFQALAVLQSRPPDAFGSGMLTMVDYVMIAVGVFQATLGVGLILKWEWARAIVNIFCWIRILLSGLSLIGLLMGGFLFGGIWVIVRFLFTVFDIVAAGTQIWLIAETDNSFMR